MSREYLDTFKVGDLDCLSLGDIEETNSVIAHLKGEEAHVIPRTIYEVSSTLYGVSAALSAFYSADYYLTCINSFASGSTFVTNHVSPLYMSSYDVPYNGNDSYTFVITDTPLDILKENVDLVDTAFIKAFGVHFLESDNPSTEPPLPDYPPVQNWSGGRTFITIRDNETLAELAIAYDLMNTRIYEEINNKYTLDFNILPYSNVYRIRHPNFLELDGNYFRVRRVEKKRNSTLMMAISCEHISYELNNEYDIAAEDEDFDWPDFLFEGTPKEILSEMLQGTRFRIGTVQFNDVVLFNSKPMGFRSMIIGLANEIGAEVKWDKFTISLVARRGADRDLSFEVGKNLISMTEVYETHANGAFNRFYDVDVIDLSRIENENAQQDLYDIQLGDTVKLVDEQFNINIDQRVISFEIDPFRKELPKIQLEHVTKNITNTIADVSSSVTDLKRIKGGGGTGGSEEVIINFNVYDTVISVPDEPTQMPEYVHLMAERSSRDIKFTGPTSLLAGLKIGGEASESAILQGLIILANENGEIFLENSVIEATVSKGFNTIGIPFSLPYLDDSYTGKTARLYMVLMISTGTFKVSSFGTSMYLKGKNIILGDPPPV